jgi:hypothetical protein
MKTTWYCRAPAASVDIGGTDPAGTNDPDEAIVEALQHAKATGVPLAGNAQRLALATSGMPSR